MKADRRSFFNSAVQCANDGLVPDGREAGARRLQQQGQDRGGSGFLCSNLPMVAGIMKRCGTPGEIANWQVYAVHKNDEYKIVEGFDITF